MCPRNGVKGKIMQSCPTLGDPLDYTVHGILQARILEWADFPFSRGSFQPRDRAQVSQIAGGFFTSWATGRLKNTGVGSLALLRRKWHLRHWPRQTLTQPPVSSLCRTKGQFLITSANCSSQHYMYAWQVPNPDEQKWINSSFSDS